MVDPINVLLTRGKMESSGDEGLGRGVELANVHGVPAAVGQMHQTEGFRRRQALRALPDPVLAFGLGQGVQIQQGLPRRLGIAIGGEARMAPYAVHMGGILPDIVDAAGAKYRPSDPILGGEDRPGLGVEGGVARVCLQPLGGLGVLALHPGHRAGGVDRLQPLIGIGGRLGVSHRRDQQGGGGEEESFHGLD